MPLSALSLSFWPQGTQLNALPLLSVLFAVLLLHKFVLTVEMSWESTVLEKGVLKGGLTDQVKKKKATQRS